MWNVYRKDSAESAREAAESTRIRYRTSTNNTIIHRRDFVIRYQIETMATFMDKVKKLSKSMVDSGAKTMLKVRLELR